MLLVVVTCCFLSSHDLPPFGVINVLLVIVDCYVTMWMVVILWVVACYVTMYCLFMLTCHCLLLLVTSLMLCCCLLCYNINVNLCFQNRLIHIMGVVHKCFIFLWKNSTRSIIQFWKLHLPCTLSSGQHKLDQLQIIPRIFSIKGMLLPFCWCICCRWVYHNVCRLFVSLLSLDMHSFKVI